MRWEVACQVIMSRDDFKRAFLLFPLTTRHSLDVTEPPQTGVTLGISDDMLQCRTEIRGTSQTVFIHEVVT
jgi:hypothetical protein